MPLCESFQEFSRGLEIDLGRQPDTSLLPFSMGKCVSRGEHLLDRR